MQPVSVVFSIYSDQESPTPLWSEVQNVYPDSAGRFSVLLGSERSQGISVDVFRDNQARWIGYTPEGGVEQRALLVAVPYAIKAADADTLGGLPASAFMQANTSKISAANSDARIVTPTAVERASLSSSSGAANYLAKFIDSSTLATSQLYENNGNVGIATTNPEAVLHVASNSARIKVQSTGPGNNAGMWLQSQPPDTTQTSKRGGVYFSAGNTSDSTTIGLTADDVTIPLLLTASGYVGMGTSSPRARLQVSDKASRIFVQSTSPGANAGQWLESVSPGGYAQRGGLYFVSGDSPATTFIALTGDDVNYHLVANRAGNIGINTTTPASKLDVNGDIHLTGNLIFSDGTMQNSAAVSSSSSGSTTGGSTSGSSTTGGSTGVSLGANNFTGDQTVTVSDTTNPAVLATNTATTGSAYGLRGQTSSTSGLAVSGYASALSGYASGVSGKSDSTNGTGVYGEATSVGSSTTYGVHGIARSAQGVGVQGESLSTMGTTYGIYGATNGDTAAAGVYGTALSTTSTGMTYGVYGESAASWGVGLFGYATTMTGSSYGVYGRVDSANGVAGQFTNTSGTGSILAGSNGTKNVFRVDTLGNVYIAGTYKTGGADYAEIMAARDHSAYEPGDVLVIDESANRRVRLASEPYATNVAGVYSTKPGIVGTPHAMMAPGSDELPVAMLGIVPCKASAENGPIRRGDLLVSAALPGHVMKGTDRSRLSGAIVGKALEPLASGTGVIQVLVTLQ